MNFARNKVEMVKKQYPVGTWIRCIIGIVNVVYYYAKRAEET